MLAFCRARIFAQKPGPDRINWRDEKEPGRTERTQRERMKPVPFPALVCLLVRKQASPLECPGLADLGTSLTWEALKLLSLGGREFGKSVHQ